MRCEECGKEVKVWFAKDGKWCCEECKKKNRNSSLLSLNAFI